MSDDESGDWSQLSVEEGFDKLVGSVGHLQQWVCEHTVSEDSELADDDRFLHPIYSTVRQTVVQLLLSSLDHLRLVGTSLGAQSGPNPFAQSTLIRTAITGASTALWMLDTPDVTERRYRALEFHFKDTQSHRQFIKNAVKQRPLPEGERSQIEALEVELRRRQGWIVEQARILRPEDNATFDSFNRAATSDTAIVRAAGTAIGEQGRVSEEWNSTALLLKRGRHSVLTHTADLGPRCSIGESPESLTRSADLSL